MRRSRNHLILNSCVVGQRIFHNVWDLTNLPENVCERDLPLPKTRTKLLLDSLHCLRPILGVDGGEAGIRWSLVSGLQVHRSRTVRMAVSVMSGARTVRLTRPW